MNVSRRTFLKLSGLAAAGATVGGLSGSMPAKAAVKGIPGIEGKALLNDSSKCIGCLSCAIACKKAHNLPDTFRYSPVTDGDTWTTVKFWQRDTQERAKGVNLRVQCMHCDQPSCAAVCPTGATYKRDDGVVSVDQQTCIGCKYCAVACPFSIPGISTETGTIRKCNFCEERLREGKITACAEACPVGAVTFGDHNDLLDKARQRVESLKSNGSANATLYGQKELGGLKVLYILPDTPSASGMPENPKLATGDSLFKWLAGLAMGGFLVSVPLRKLFQDGAGDMATDRSKRGE